MNHHFFALLSRMKYIARWGLMRSTVSENIAEHSYHVAVTAQALAIIKNTYFGGNLNAERCAAIALYHDCSEIITGDLPTPVKYLNPGIISAYKNVEKQANDRLISLLPQQMRPAYVPMLEKQEEDAYLWKLVKAADKISAHIKCFEEVKAGNHEFSVALASTRRLIDELDMPEVEYYMEHFLESYGLALDELK